MTNDNDQRDISYNITTTTTPSPLWLNQVMGGKTRGKTRRRIWQLSKTGQKIGCQL
jgi:hypothetical protein